MYNYNYKIMKNVNFKLLYILILSLTLACSGDDGEMGPEGPQGQQGEQGIQGIQGEQGNQGPQGEPGEDGVDGEDGNANVYSSPWILANFEGASNVTKYMNIDFPPELPSGVAMRNDYAVFVYFSGFGDGSIYPLPVLNFRSAEYTFGYGSGSAGIGDILIKVRALSGILTEFQISPDRGTRFRYVIIPSNTASRSAVDYSDYNSVKSFYNLKD